MSNWIRILPGAALSLLIMLAGYVGAEWLGKALHYVQGLPGDSSSPISGIFVAIILGLLIRNIIGLHERFRAGVAFSIKYVLRFGIILLGVRLSFIDVMKLGAWGIPIVLVCVTAGLLFTLWMTNKLNQPHRLGTLIAVGTGICGVTAIVGTSPGIKANDEEVAYAIANITLFGIIAMFLYPYVAFYLFQNEPIKVGLFLGTTIHETAQVAGAALIYDQVFGVERVIDTATITKLTRNVLLIAVVPLMSYYYLKSGRDRARETEARQPKWYQLIPLFVVGFIAAAVFRTIGDAGVTSQGMAYGILDPDRWQAVWSSLNTFGSTYLLGTAMAGVGLSTDLKVFRGLGIKPFYIGFIAALSVTAVSLVMVFLLGDFITL